MIGRRGARRRLLLMRTAGVLGQKGVYDVRLGCFVLVEEALEAVENGAAQMKRLLLVYHGQQKNLDDWTMRFKIIERLIVF